MSAGPSGDGLVSGGRMTGSDGGGGGWSAGRRWTVAALIGVAGAVFVGGWVGVAAGLLVGLVAERYLRRITPASWRAEQRRAAADLPYAADLLAAALRAGLPVDRSVRIVADALGGPVADRLARVGRSLELGLGAELAWSSLAELPGGDRLVTAVGRSAHSGAALAAAFGRLADDQRAAREIAAEAAGRRAGVLIVLPLGLCFLPAFVFAGIVPVIVAVLGDVLR